MNETGDPKSISGIISTHRDRTAGRIIVAYAVTNFIFVFYCCFRGPEDRELGAVLILFVLTTSMLLFAAVTRLGGLYGAKRYQRTTLLLLAFIGIGMMNGVVGLIGYARQLPWDILVGVLAVVLCWLAAFGTAIFARYGKPRRSA